MEADIRSRASDALREISDVQSSHPLSIIELSKPITATYSEPSRNSDVSADAVHNPTPVSLEADLIHYKELFSKLRFSYVEQVTKEKFLRAIVGDPPLIIDHHENVQLEAELAQVKTSLQSQKAEVATFVAELERQSRELSSRYEAISIGTAQLESLPDSIANLQQSIDSLRRSETEHEDPRLRLPLSKTRELLEAREVEIASIDRQIASLQSALPKKIRELDRVNAELRDLDVQVLGSEAAAKEAQRRQEEGLGGAGGDLEARARWYRAVEGSLRGMLEIPPD